MALTSITWRDGCTLSFGEAGPWGAAGENMDEQHELRLSEIVDVTQRR